MVRGQVGFFERTEHIYSKKEHVSKVDPPPHRE
jgi:hypothetical protein